MAQEHCSVLVSTAETLTGVALFPATDREKEYESALELVAGVGALVMYEKVWLLGVDTAWAKIMSLTILLGCVGILAVSLYIRKRLQQAQRTVQQRRAKVSRCG